MDLPTPAAVDVRDGAVVHQDYALYQKASRRISYWFAKPLSHQRSPVSFQLNQANCAVSSTNSRATNLDKFVKVDV
jgi:hypothetical protein